MTPFSIGIPWRNWENFCSFCAKCEKLTAAWGLFIFFSLLHKVIITMAKPAGLSLYSIEIPLYTFFPPIWLQFGVKLYFPFDTICFIWLSLCVNQSMGIWFGISEQRTMCITTWVVCLFPKRDCLWSVCLSLGLIDFQRTVCLELSQTK